MLASWLALLCCPLGCGDGGGDSSPAEAQVCAGWADSQVDVDEDGFPPCKSGDVPADCDDLAQDVYPGAPELCNGIDDDCDGLVDDEDSDAPTDTRTLYFPDVDGDGEGDATHEGIYLCAQPEGWLTTNTDCDDEASDINTSVPEACDDLDTDCDGVISDHSDTDGDGYAPCDGDCDPQDPAVAPGVQDLCDSSDTDCDGIVDEDADPLPWYPDADGDGYGEAGSEAAFSCGAIDGRVNNALDCDDGEKSISPAATEACEGTDQDCDGVIDNGFDKDGDGYTSCDTAANALDCNDARSDVFPGAPEACDKADQDCDGVADEGTAQLTFYADADSDGFHDPNATILACQLPAAGYMSPAEGASIDCDDGNSQVSPEGKEDCDAIDNDCDGALDEGFDSDLDGATRCDVVGNPIDCDDSDPGVYPAVGEQAAALETCDKRDQDCDEAIDEDIESPPTWYLDSDGDGAHNPAVSLAGCPQPEGYIAAAAADCDDTRSDIRPGMGEACDGLDQDCDGLVDEGIATNTYRADLDGDGALSQQVTVQSCAATPPTGYFALAAGAQTDCNDGAAAIYPGAAEACNGVNDDCDGSVDEGFDGDGDGFTRCDTAGNPADCNDVQAAIKPGTAEACDGIDNDCDGRADEGFDGDGDGIPSCFDPEACNGVDDDGDSRVDEGFDADGDGFTRCDTAGNPADCDDGQAAIKPGAAEACDGIDNDCDGRSDEGFDGDGDGIPSCFDPEVCNGVDDDGDSRVDEGFDADGDGFTRCDTAGNPVDCDDQSSGVRPGASPTGGDCVDDDCDGSVDEAGTTPDCRLMSPEGERPALPAHLGRVDR